LKNIELICYVEENLPKVLIKEKRFQLGGFEYLHDHEILFYNDDSREKFRQIMIDIIVIFLFKIEHFKIFCLH
jgi:hypothetical protein